ncbi:hypothetical protein GCM10010123_01430 [Pilimelia anulata]|uniref:TniQ domain-containing protein n=2 Tax=Pilimelia anulata TaxID=53371 RepID=A0A8J3F743_9ACTN|nr:hypothetical protein GCM10010123_01430 [Pilimelia anulata]
MLTGLTGEETTALTAATGTPDSVLAAMTLRRFDGVAVTINAQRRVLEHPPAWRRHAGSRYCPRCLRDGGRWQLAWRLPWTACCPHHHRILAEQCPACLRRVRPDRPGHRGRPSVPGTCTAAPAGTGAGGHHTPVCGQRLDEVDTVVLRPDGSTIAAAGRVTELIDTSAAGEETGRDALADIFKLATRALSAVNHSGLSRPAIVEGILADCGGVVPAPYASLGPVAAHTVAVSTAVAVAAHTAGPVGDEVLAWLLNASGRQQPHSVLRPWLRCQPPLVRRVLAVCDPTLRAYHRLAYRSSTANPSPRDTGTDELVHRAAALPALMWPTWTAALLPVGQDRSGATRGARAALAALTLVPGSRVSTTQAMRMLGAPAAPNAISSYLARLTETQHRITIDWLAELADLLDTDGSAIDYRRRRALFSTGATVDRGAYAELASQLGWPTPSRLQLRILDQHLTVLLTGAPPCGINIYDGFNPLTVALPTALQRFLDQQSRHCLDTHHISEPCTWAPNLPTHRPPLGIDYRLVDIAHLADQITAHLDAGRPLARITDATGIPPGHIKLLAESTEVTAPARWWNRLADDPDHDTLLDPNRLRCLYYDQELPLRDIALRCLADQTTVRAAMTAAGIHQSPSRPRKANISREWFDQHFIGSGKTVRQAARAAGCSATTLRTYAKSYGIALGESASDRGAPA